MAGDFAIPQRALHLPTDAGRILWECVSLVTPEAVAALRERGGVDRIVISHPHFYSAMVEWSEALSGVPILLHEADRAWVQRPSPRIEHWRGDTLRLSDTVTLLRCGGHFPGIDGSNIVHEDPSETREIIALYLKAQSAENPAGFSPAANNNWHMKALPANVDVRLYSSPREEAKQLAKKALPTWKGGSAASKAPAKRKPAAKKAAATTPAVKAAAKKAPAKKAAPVRKAAKAAA